MKRTVPLFQKKATHPTERNEFRQLYEDYWENLYKQIIRILPDEEEAADVVQQTFVDLWVMKEKIPQIKSIKSFLFIMARNLAFKRLKERLKSENYRDYYASHYDTSISLTEQEVDFRELKTQIDSHIDKLPEKMKEVFLLSRKSDLSYMEIAQQLNISDKTVKKQISNAIRILKLKIDKEYISYLTILLILDIF